MGTFEERLEAILDTIEFENLNEDIPHSYSSFAEKLLDGSEENFTEMDFRLDHEMSGYNNSFNAINISIKLEEISETEYKVTTKYQSFGGKIPKSMMRHVDEGDLSWEDIWEDYDDLTDWVNDETVSEETFSTLEEALKDIDNTCGPYEG